MAAISLGTLALAEFKTAYLQRAIPLDAIVADTELKVGALVKLDMSGPSPVVYRSATLANATHLIAQSDMTLIPEDHPKTDYRDYRYSSAVKAGSEISASSLLGIYAASTDLPAASGNSGKTAFVVVDNKIYSCDGTNWTAGSVVASKHVSLYPLVNKNDVKVLA